MFLYARLVIDNLASQVCMEDVREEASNLPNGLEEAFVGDLGSEIGC